MEEKEFLSFIDAMAEAYGSDDTSEDEEELQRILHEGEGLTDEEKAYWGIEPSVDQDKSDIELIESLFVEGDGLNEIEKSYWKTEPPVRIEDEEELMKFLFVEGDGLCEAEKQYWGIK